jgi:hypothetical protein
MKHKNTVHETLALIKQHKTIFINFSEGWIWKHSTTVIGVCENFAITIILILIEVK